MFEFDLRKDVRRLLSLATLAVLSLNSGGVPVSAQTLSPDGTRRLSDSTERFQGEGSGALTATDSNGKEIGKCALRHTGVSVKVAGYFARVTVKQLFHNPFKDKIEAVYTFPLSESGAVDDLTMRIGQRTIHGTIKRREEARQIYDQAREDGNSAALLEQERPNIFTQSVANIDSGKEIEITLQYSEMLPYEAGHYSFAFPTVVGPRFMPGAATGQFGLGWSANTTGVPDASKISPPPSFMKNPQRRAGHDLSISVDLDGAVPVGNISSGLHEINLERTGPASAHIELKDKDMIANKDFVLNWDVAASSLQSGYLTHKTGKTGYATFMILPPKRIQTAEVAPKEMIFLVDKSGSQDGPPLEKAKETLKYIVNHMNPQDTFQIVAFSDETEQLFEKPMPAEGAMKEKALAYIRNMTADGGTWMGPAVRQVCAGAADNHRLRIVTFMTDGFVGNDLEILAMIRKYRGSSRWFSFGTGNSVNRFLIDGIAKEGGGEAEYVLLNKSADEVGKHFYDRISTPVLTDVKVNFEGVKVTDVFPRQIADVWAERPLYIKGRYTKAGSGEAVITGFSGGKPYMQRMPVVLPEQEENNFILPQIWARAAVDALMSADWSGMQNGEPRKRIKDEIVRLALSQHIMTQFTSFVAVDETATTSADKARTVVVPVEMPDGVSYEKIFGEVDRETVQYVESQAGNYANSPIRVVGSVAASSSAGITAGALQSGVFNPIPAQIGFGMPSAIINWLVASSRDANLFGGEGFSAAPQPAVVPPISAQSSGSPVGVFASGQAGTQSASAGSPGIGSYSGGGRSSAMLQGATNGTIGPASTATVITGINTSGTVRVNNLANLEALLNIIANALNLVVLGVGLGAIVCGMLRGAFGRNGALKLVLFGAIWLAVGLTFSPLLLPYVVWKVCSPVIRLVALRRQVKAA
jgi:Ca-activated chloride channel family protein